MPPPIRPTDFLPLRPLELLVLAMVAEKPLHGYGIRQAILDHTGGWVDVEAGNLYRHIRRLHAESLLEIVRPRRLGDAERRREFRITPAGRRVLAAELERLRDLIRFAEARGLVSAASV